METFKAALRWVVQGISVVPIRFRAKQPLIYWAEYQSRLPRLDELQQWFSCKDVNLAVVTGWRGLTILDFDTMISFQIWREFMRGNDLQDTYMIQTTRGVHVYYFLDEPAQNYSIPGMLDVKAERGYCLVPPSIHPSGAAYRVMQDLSIRHVQSICQVLPEIFQPATEEAPAVIEQPAMLDPWEMANKASEPVGVSVEEIKKRVRIEQLLGELEPTGNGYYKTRCPLHDDQNPSMWVDLKRQICGCYAGCTSKPLDVINLYARIRGVSNDQAIRELATW